MRELVLSEPVVPDVPPGVVVDDELPGAIVELLPGDVVVLLLELELESVLVEPLVVPGDVVEPLVLPGVVVVDDEPLVLPGVVVDELLPGDVVDEPLVLPGEVVDELLLPGVVVDDEPLVLLSVLVPPGVVVLGVARGALEAASGLGGAPSRPGPGPVPGLVGVDGEEGAWAVAMPPSARRAAEVAATAAASLNLVMVSIS